VWLVTCFTTREYYSRLAGSIAKKGVARSFSYFHDLTNASCPRCVLVRACAINSRLISVIHIRIRTPYLKG
jgi:hypothetical protein